MSLSDRFARINPTPKVRLDETIKVAVDATEAGEAAAAEDDAYVDEYEVAADDYDQEEAAVEAPVYERSAPSSSYGPSSRWREGGSSRGRGGRGGDFGHSSNTCYNCGGVGHFARECPSEPKAQGSRPGGKTRTNTEWRSDRQSRDRPRNERKPRDSQSLDDELNAYWGKGPNTKKLDDDLDSYWKQKPTASE